ncbi:hypothetical protein NHX12_011243, partial [Muraenolepis orangiensis]
SSPRLAVTVSRRCQSARDRHTSAISHAVQPRLPRTAPRRPAAGSQVAVPRPR